MELARGQNLNEILTGSIEPMLSDENITYTLYIEMLVEKEARQLAERAEGLVLNKACPELLIGRVRQSIGAINNILPRSSYPEEIKAMFRDATDKISKIKELHTDEQDGVIDQDQQREKIRLELQLRALKFKIVNFCQKVLDPEGTESSEGSEEVQPTDLSTNEDQDLKLAA